MGNEQRNGLKRFSKLRQSHRFRLQFQPLFADQSLDRPGLQGRLMQRLKHEPAPSLLLECRIYNLIFP